MCGNTLLVDTTSIFRGYNLTWQILGLKNERFKYFWLIYDLILTIFITICHPIHMLLGSLQAENLKAICSSLVMNVAAVAVSLKHFTYRPQLKTMDEIMKLYAELDGNIKTSEECEHHRQSIQRPAKQLTNLLFIVYYGIVFGALAVVFQNEERVLLYSGRFPFDWHASTFKYLCAICYQCLGGMIESTQNIACDGFGPLALCALAEHMQLLSMRISKIGHTNCEQTESHLNAQLNNCALDFQRLMRITELLQRTISWGMFIQFIAGAFNVCVAVVSIVFFSDNFFVYMSHASVLLGVCIQMFPSCYYGSVLEANSQRLPYAFFSCNWSDRQTKFRRSITVLTEFSLHPLAVFAGGMIRIHLDTFFATMKMSYSLFCIIYNIK